MRGNYWYDTQIKDHKQQFKNITNAGRTNASKASGAQILDLFVYHSYNLKDQLGTIRLGKQVLSWGESTFISGGINASNPMNIAAFRRSGSEIKESLIPVEMLSIAQNISANLAVEAFYQFKWRQNELDNCGTFFANDISANGCNHNLTVLNTQQKLNAQGAPIGLFKQMGVNWSDIDEGVIVMRQRNQNAKDNGQFGFSLRYMFNPLETEFGLFFMNYHSKMPFLGANALSAQDMQAWLTNPNVASMPSAMRDKLTPIYLAGKSSYFMEYPQNIRLYGISFATTLPNGTAMQGEISYRPNLPLQINTTDVLYALIPGASKRKHKLRLVIFFLMLRVLARFYLPLKLA